MAISSEEVSKLAKLARLAFNDEQKQKLQQELSAILDYVDQLKQIENKVPVDAVDQEGLNLVRDDVVEERTAPEEFLAQAPQRQGNFFKVKNVLE